MAISRILGYSQSRLNLTVSPLVSTGTKKMERAPGRRWTALPTRAVLCLLSVLLPMVARAQVQLVPVITTVAGDGTSGYFGDDGAATGAELYAPQGVAVDAYGNLYIADDGNNRIRMVSPSGIITTVAGEGTAGYSGDNGPATSAELHGPTGVAVDAYGNIYIADDGNSRIRMVNSSGIITTVAGNGTPGYSGDNGPATSAELNYPFGVAVDASGNLYIADTYNSRIRMVNPSGIITTVAGNGTAGYSGDNGPATSAEFNFPAGVAVDATGNLYIADVSNLRIRMVNPSGIITTVAGNGTPGYSGDNGPATSAELWGPIGVGVDASGNLYIADQAEQRVRTVKMATGIITTVAGNGAQGYSGDNGLATSAELNDPWGVAVDASGNLYIADFGNQRIRKVSEVSPPLNETVTDFPATAVGSSAAVQNMLIETTATETITSISAPLSQGGSQEFSVGTITGCTVGTSNPSGTTCTVPITFTPAYPGIRQMPLQVVTSTGNVSFGLAGIGTGPLVALTPGIIATVAGNGTAGYSGDNGPATSAEIYNPFGVALDASGSIYIADTANDTIRKVSTNGIITTVAGNGNYGESGDNGPATSAELLAPRGLAVDGSGNIYIADGGYRVRMVNTSGIITTVAGNGTFGNSGDNGPATSAELSTDGVAVDGSGNLYIADAGNDVIRKVSPSGIITTVAGNGTAGYSGDNGPATSAELYGVNGLTVDGSGDIYIVDGGNQRIRKVNTSGIITTVAGNGTAGYSGDNGAATSAELNYPFGVAVDASGNLYIADSNNNVIRKVTPGGIITTVVGNGTGGYSGDNGAATSAELNSPAAVALDASGNIYIADNSNQLIREVNVGTTAAPAFTNTLVGSQSTDSPQSFQLNNIGNSALTIAAPSMGANPSIATGFNYDASSSCPQLSLNSSAYNLAAGAGCTYAVDFIPTAVGLDSGSLVLGDNSLNNSNSTQTVSLSGAGTTSTITLSPGSLPSATVGTSYSQAITADGGTAPYTYALTAGNLPPGVTLSAGLLSGTPLGGGTFSFTVTATDSSTGTGPYTGSQAYSLIVAPPDITLSPTSLPAAAGGKAYNQTITATGGTAPYTYAVSGGSLPTGVTLGSTGSLSGTPMAAGTFSFTVTATDSSMGTGPYTGSQAYSLSVSAPAFNLATGGTFAVVNVGSTSATPITVTFTLWNAVTLGSTAALTRGAPGLDFSDAGTGTCTANTAYNAGATCTVSVNFTPTVPGPRYGAAELLDGSGNLIATAYLQGTGAGPQVNFLPGNQSTLGSGFDLPGSVAVDGNGNVFVADTENNAVKEIVAAGGYTTVNTLGSGFASPEGVALDGSGNLFVSDSGNQVVKEIVAAGGYTTVITLGAGFSTPAGLAVDGSGNIFVADPGSRAVKEVTAASGYAVSNTLASAARAFSSPRAVALDTSGDVYVADSGFTVVKEILAGGGSYTRVNTLGSGLSQPYGVAVDGRENVFVADSRNNAVKEILASGGYTTINTLGSGFSNPEGVGLDGNGNVFVADSGNNRIEKLDYADPPSLNFPTATQAGSTDTTDGPQSVTVSNIGNMELESNPPGLAAPADFMQVSGSGTPPDCTASFSLAAGSSCNISIEFAPVVSRTLNESFVLTDNALNAAAATQSISLTGTGESVGTATTLMSSLNPSSYGQFVTITATVSSSTGTTPPSGTVQFNVDGSPVGSAVTLSSGTAGFTSGTLAAGTHNITAAFTPGTNSPFTASSSMAFSQVVNKAVPTVSFTGAPANAPYESTFTVAATTNASTTAVITASGSCSVTGATVTITAPSGTCSLTATWAADNNYLAASATQSTTATQATPVITWAAPSAITYGTALSGTQLDATATYNGTTVTGAFVYTPAKGTLLTAGTQTLSVTFTPTKTADFTNATASVTLQVNQATPKITWAKPAAITYGTALSSTQLDATASAPGTFGYSPAAGTILTAGSQTLSVTFTPTDTVDYAPNTDSVTITVNKAAPTVTWATPAAITYGTALSSTQLDATASVPGTLVYSPAAGAIEAGGSDKLSVTFTPTDTVDYPTVTTSVMLQVNPATPSINWATPAAITYGSDLTATQLDATATYNGSTVAGTFTYTPAKGAVLGAGTQTLSVSFAPSNTSNYTAPPSASVALQVSPATPKITWAKPAAITYGTALSSAQLDATASVPGSFVYSPGTGTILDAGTQSLSVTFTPADTIDYLTASDSVTIAVNQATSTSTITSNSPDPSVVGQSVTVDFSVTGNGVPTGTVTVTASTGENCSGTLGGGVGNCAVTFTAAGSPKLTAAYSGDTNFKPSSSAKVTQTVSP